MSQHQKFPCQNQSKSFAAFLEKPFPRAIHFSGYTNMPRFVKIQYFSCFYIKFQLTECIITLNFDHFASSPNYVRGVTI